MPSQNSTYLSSHRYRPKAQSCTIALGTALTLMLVGCASGPAPGQDVPDMAIPANWSAAASPTDATASTASLAQWWRRFNDPLLTTLIAQALQSNTSIRTAQAAIRQARALRDVQAAGLLPGVGASVSAQRGKSNGLEASNRFSAGIDASWEPDVFGGKRSAVNAAEADTRAAETTLANVQVSMAAEVALAYIQLRGQQAQLLIARNNLASQSETLQITDWRAQAGLITSLEVEQARTANEQTLAQIPVLEASMDKTRHSLAVLTGQAPDSLRELVQSPLPVPQAADDLALGIPAQTLRQRPDVRSAEHRISAALARVSVAEAARYPSFSISGSLGLDALTLAGLGNGAAVASSLLASVSVPLFDGGAARAQVQAQSAALEQARVAYQAVVLTALQDVEDALVALRGDRERLVHLQQAATAAANADLLARDRFSSGLIDFQIVLQTQRTLLTAQDSVASASADISADHVRLYKALGGGWY
jgi:NodT family efflux transporter outer membrane factor (OMF) lipoprotein